MNKKRGSAAIIIIVIILAAVVAYFLYFRSPAVEPISDSGDTGAPLLVGDNAIYVSDAKPAATVMVGFAVLADGGYVVIHEDSDGKPGAIVGNSDILSQGENKDFEAALSRESIDGETLYAMIHSDNGDGEFNPAEDLPIKDDQENVVLMKFQVSESAEEPGAVSL